MAENSKIEWTDHTANLWHGCTKVHEGCDHCYAETLSVRWKRDIWGNDKPRMAIASVWKDLAKYQKLAAAAGVIHKVFVGSMMDIFEKPMPMKNSKGESFPEEWTIGTLRDVLFKRISDGDFPNLKFLLLTKRPSNILKHIPIEWIDNPPANVMFGTSPVNQETYNTLWPHLAKVKGKRFLSVEPMLDSVILRSYCPSCEGLLNSLSPTCGTCHSTTIRPDWVIVGGESGHHKRPFNPDWARSIRDQCHSWDVPFFMKQWDKIKEVPEDLMIRQFPV